MNFEKMPRRAKVCADRPPVCRLGLATRGNTHLEPEDVFHAVDQGVNYFNWCGHSDGLSKAIRSFGVRREEVTIAWQIQSSTRAAAAKELDAALRELHVDCIDVVTLYYVESAEEWTTLTGPNGAYGLLVQARQAGKIRSIGLTSHQRPLAADIAAGKLESANVARAGGNADKPLDMLMIRYNAAHRGAETEVFPVAQGQKLPLVAFTCLRWGALLESTADDPPGFHPPPAKEWYRFVLTHPAVDVALAAPNGRQELDHVLELLEDWRPTPETLYCGLRAHGDRVRRHAPTFW